MLAGSYEALQESIRLQEVSRSRLLQAARYTPTELSTEAAVSLDPAGQGFRISSSALTLRAAVPKLDQQTFARLAKDAEQNCPVSKVLKAEITLDAELV